MKKSILFFSLIFIVSFLNAQDENTKADTTKLKFGNKTVIIIDENSKDSNDSNFEIKEDNDEKLVEKNNYNPKDYSRWAGINVGLNGFGERNDLPENNDIDLFDINPFKSRVWNFNLFEYSVSIVNRHILLTTGLGFEYRNYRFNNNVDFVYDDDKIDLVENTNIKYDKNKLKISYVQIPLLLELNTSSRPKKGIYLAAGVIGGIRMSTSLNQEYEENGLKIEKKISDSFNFNPYQVSGTVRVGIRKFTLITNFDLLSMFKEDGSKVGDSLVPFSLGIQLVGF